MPRHLGGSVRRACDSQSQGHKFKFHIGCRDYLKTLIQNKTKQNHRTAGSEKNWGTRNVLYLDSSDSFTRVYICQNSYDLYFKWVLFIVH